MASYSGMSAEDIKMREDYKKQQAAAITASRDYKKNNYLSAMDQQTATQSAVTTTPKTNTNTQTLGGTSSTGGSSSSGGYTGGGYVAGSGTTTRNARRNAHAADIRSGYKLRNEAEDKTQNLSYYDKLSDYDRDVRTQYFYDTKVQEAKTQQEIQSLVEENDDLFVQSVPIAQRASAGATGARHHNNYLQNQIADNNARIRQLNGAGVVLSHDEIEARKQRNKQIEADTYTEIDSLNNSVTADDLDNMSRDDYMAGYYANLAKRLDLDAQATGAVKENKVLDRINEEQSIYYDDDFGGQFQASLKKGRIEQDANLSWNDYLVDPTQGNRQYAMYLEDLLSQYEKNNTQTLDEDAILPHISQEFAESIPAQWDEQKASAKGAAIGVGAGIVTMGAIPIDSAADIGSNIAVHKHNYDLTRGQTFRGLIQMGVNEDIAATAAENTAIVSGWIDAAGDFATNGISKTYSSPESFEILDDIADHYVSNGVDLPKESIKDCLHSVIVRNATVGNVNVTPEEILEQTLTDYLFTLGFYQSYEYTS